MTYEGDDKYGNHSTRYKAVVSSPEEAVAVIEQWHSYGKPTAPTLIVNARSRDFLVDIFNEDISTPTSFCTTNCGCFSIKCVDALADTIAEHEAIVQQKAKIELGERKQKLERAKQYRFKLYSRIVEGWYFVSIPLELCDYDGKQVHKTYTCYIEAKSKMDAALKALKDAEKTASNKGLSFAKCHTWEDTDVMFAGMKVDGGFSIEKYKEYHNGNGASN